MKIAKLHNGEMMHFHPDTPDPDMDAAVQQRVAGMQPPAQPGGEVLPVVMNAIQSHLANRKVEDSNRAAMDIQTRSEQQQSAERMGQMIVGAQQQMGQSMADAFARLSDPLVTMAQNSNHAPEIIRAINNLADTIMEVGKMVVDIISTPRDITDDAEGQPRTIAPRIKTKM